MNNNPESYISNTGAASERGAIIRLAMLMTHYRQPIDWTGKRLIEAEKTMGKWLKAAKPPAEGDHPDIVLVMEALMDDLNTPKAIAIMHGYRASGNGPALYQAMKFLGLIDPFSCSPSDWRTLPDDIPSDAGPDVSRLVSM